MTSFVDARDHDSGALKATLPSSVLPSVSQPHTAGLSRQLRVAFVAAGQLTVHEAEAVDFEIRENSAGEPR